MDNSISGVSQPFVSKRDRLTDVRSSCSQSIALKPTDSSKATIDHLIVVSLMSGDGSTGVETHYNGILRVAQTEQISTSLITPYSSTRWLQRVANFFVNRMNRTQPERAHLWLRRIHTRRVKRHLRQELNRAKNRNSVIYAQDPLSAKIALEVRPGPHCRVVTVAHFNVSEAQEFIDKGVTKLGGQLWFELSQVEQDVLPRVDQLIFVSQYMRKRICARNPKLAQVPTLVLPNFTPPRRRTTAISTKQKHAVAIGSLEARKNQSFLIHVIAACRDLGVRYTLDIIGTGDDLSDLKALVSELKLEEQIKFLGFVPDAAKLIGNYRVLLHAAKMESFGIVLIEAMACSVPVIAYPVGGVPEVFSDGIEGLYWHSENIGNAARQLISLLEDEPRYERMRQAAINRYTEKFSDEATSPKWLNTILDR